MASRGRTRSLRDRKTFVELRTKVRYTSVQHSSERGVMKIEIKKIGNSDGLLLPRELMQRLDLKRGQQLHITELPGGGFQALPYDPDFERTMEIADEIMEKYRDTLATLAK
jgi:putative addiction module antidote